MSASDRQGGRRLRLGFVGWGAIATRVAQLLAEREAPVDIVAIAVRDADRTRPDLPTGARLISEPGELAGLGLDMVIEAAGRPSVLVWGEAALRHARRFAVSSTSAFCDEALLARLVEVARENGSQIVIPPGALGGMDALTAASAVRIDEVVHFIVKPPRAWKGTAAETLLDLDALAEPKTFFAGTAREAADAFPQNANVAVISALAGIGLDRTRVELVADPAASRNSHRLSASGAFGRMEMLFENEPLKTNPKSSELTALNLVRLVENQVAPLAH
jgi:aspartate dehydrogenase